MGKKSYEKTVREGTHLGILITLDDVFPHNIILHKIQFR